MRALLTASMILALLTPYSNALAQPVTQVALPDNCDTAFNLLYQQSTTLANEKRYVEAAALREASANVFQDCLHQGRAPRDGEYPLDGVGAYVVAGVFWHLAGQVTEAKRALDAGKVALQSVLHDYTSTTIDPAALKHLQEMISNADSGNWAVWSENDEPRPTASRIAPSKLMQHDWWSHLTREEKLKVVEGEIDGLVNGWWRAFTDYDTKVWLMLINDKLKKSSDWTLLDKELSKVSRDVKGTPPSFSKKLGFYINGIDGFYDAYPSASRVTVGNIMQCLSDKPWQSCADVAKLFSSSGSSR